MGGRLRSFAWQSGFEDGRAGRWTSGWTGDDLEAYESGRSHGLETADIVGGVVGVCVIREDPDTGERRVEYFNDRSGR